MSSSHPAGQYPNIIGEDMPLSVRIREIIIPMDTRLPGLGAQYIYRIYGASMFAAACNILLQLLTHGLRKPHFLS